MNSLFITITNANFDDDMILDEIKKGLELRKKIKNKLVENNATLLAQHENKKYTT